MRREILRTKMSRYAPSLDGRVANLATYTDMLPCSCAIQNADRPDSEPESESEDEAIVVTRQEEEVNPEDEAEFEREYAKMMAESIDSRKFDRKPLFDVPLPVRPKVREASEGLAPNAPSTMAFSLLTKRGNRQQVKNLLFWR
jgi:regulator of nonsense transcripts 2